MVKKSSNVKVSSEDIQISKIQNILSDLLVVYLLIVRAQCSILLPEGGCTSQEALLMPLGVQIHTFEEMQLFCDFTSVEEGSLSEKL